ncbi:hypothetical protein PIB30_028004 [Stylosanthes scabra]|uniref:Uncharacterized protein n=1 Tax=Stylosanthes scabra TaxID=79078 RepID=A0ABU6X8F2_9FABA|nr:hypothetical protein [Stylosanthes scabra]
MVASILSHFLLTRTFLARIHNLFGFRYDDLSLSFSRTQGSPELNLFATPRTALITYSELFPFCKDGGFVPLILRKVTGSSSFMTIRAGATRTTSKREVRVALMDFVTFARKEPYSDPFRVVVGLQEDNRHVSSHLNTRNPCGVLDSHRQVYRIVSSKKKLDLGPFFLSHVWAMLGTWHKRGVGLGGHDGSRLAMLGTWAKRDMMVNLEIAYRYSKEELGDLNFRCRLFKVLRWGGFLPASDEKGPRVLQMRHRLNMLRESDFIWVPHNALDVVGVVDPAILNEMHMLVWRSVTALIYFGRSSGTRSIGCCRSLVECSPGHGRRWTLISFIPKTGGTKIVGFLLSIRLGIGIGRTG